MQTQPALHQYLQHCLDRTPVAFIEWDKDLRVVQWSQRAEELFGWKESEVCGLLPNECRFFQNDEGVRIRETLWRIVSGELDQVVDRFESFSKDGRRIECVWHTTSEPDVTNGEAAVFSFVLDCSPEPKFVKLKKQYDVINYGLLATNIGCWSWELDSGRVEWFGNMETIFGYAKDAFNSTTEMALANIHPEDRPKVVAEFQSCFSQLKRDYLQDYRLAPRPDIETGVVRWVRSAGRIEYSAEGTPCRIVGTAIDITHEKESEEMLMGAKQAAESSNALKSAFLANMSHEIRTPLGIILGFSELLSDPELHIEERNEYMNVISRNGEHLSRLIDDILDLSKIEAGRLDVHPSVIEISAALQEILENLQASAFEKGVGLNVDFEIGMAEHIHVDAVRFKQILTNLTNNALKFTERGEINVVVAGDPVTRELRVIVRDTGVGISEKGQKLLFRPFSQADRSSRRNFGGTGLGLALSKKIASSMGGDVRLVESTVNEGSTFELRLPASVFDLPIPENSVEHPFSGELAKSLSGLKILLADDSQDNQLLLERFLKKRGAELAIVGDGAMAIETAMCGTFDIVLMDVQMPKMDGYEATRRLREKGFAKPIIALTAHAMKGERRRALEAGCSDHLSKPVSQCQLVATILRLVPSSRP